MTPRPLKEMYTKVLGKSRLQWRKGEVGCLLLLLQLLTLQDPLLVVVPDQEGERAGVLPRRQESLTSYQVARLEVEGAGAEFLQKTLDSF